MVSWFYLQVVISSFGKCLPSPEKFFMHADNLMVANFNASYACIIEPRH